MRIAAVAQKLCVSSAWLRELEKAGRIPPAARDCNGHRRFTEEDVDRLRRLLYGPDDARNWKPDGIAWP
jgi:DNA-binding transcriptional MerR regulator